MTTVKIDMLLQDSSGSINKRTKETKELNKELTRAQQLGKSGVAGGDVAEYGRSRAVGAGTGAGARDFANQAQGLGGLVRIYATFAANLFAAQAAFNALKEAADTQNLIRGLDQLGASSGIALGALAKSFANATGGAISLREAATAAAKATSSGLDSAQFLELGQVAQKASQALGISLPDAISRITRAVTKLEPELLDELGIFTKIGPAVDAYALKLGVTASSLNEFQRIQAFTNATIAEGNKKFSEIEINTNPYDKLLASLKNVSVTILDLVNSVIGPIAKLFADNSTLIGLAISGIAIKLLKTAQPALASWGLSLKAAADKAAKSSLDIENSFGENFIEKINLKEQLPKLQKDLDQVNQAYSKAVKDFKAESPIKYRESAALRLRGLDGDKALTSRQLKAVNQDIAKFSALQTDEAKKQVAFLQNIVNLNNKKLAAEKASVDAQIRATTEIDKQAKIGTGYWQRERIANDARSKSKSLGLLSGISESVSKEGVVGGLKDFYGKLGSTTGIGKINKAVTGTAGLLLGVAKGADILFSSFGRLFGQIGIAIFAFELLDGWFSSNKKQLEEYSGATDVLNTSVDALTKTQEKYKDSITVESLTAFNNSLKGISSSVDDLIIKFDKVTAATNNWDKLVDSIKDLFGFGIEDTLADSLTKGIVSAIQSTKDPEIRRTLEGNLNKLLGTTNLDPKTLEANSSALVKNRKEISGYIKEASNSSNVLNNNLNSVINSLKQTDKIYQELTQEQNKNFTKSQQFYLSQFETLNKFNVLLRSSGQNIRAFVDNLKGDDISNKFVTLSKDFITLMDAVPNIETEINRVVGLINRWVNVPDEFVPDSVKLNRALLDGLLKSRELLLGEAKKILNQSVIDLVTEINKSSALAFERIRLDFQKKAISLFIETPEAQKELTRIELRSIDIRIQEINALNSLTDQLRSRELQDSITKAEQGLKTKTGQDYIEADRALQGLRNTLAVVEGRTTTAILAERGSVVTEEAIKEDERKRGSKQSAFALGQERNFAQIEGFIRQQRVQSEQNRRRAEESRQEAGLSRSVYKEGGAFRELSKVDQISFEFADKLDSSLAPLQDKLMGVKDQLVAIEAVEKQWGATTSTRSQIAEYQAQEASLTSQVALTTALVQSQRDRAIELEKISELSAREILDLNTKASLEDEGFNSKSLQLDTEQQLLQIGYDKKQISEDLYNEEMRRLQLLKIEQSLEQKLASLRSQREIKMREFVTKVQTAGDATQIEQLIRERDAYFALNDAQKKYAIDTANSQITILNNTEMLTTRQKAYEDIFISSFDKMTDAIIDFTKTGKLNFQDMVNSMIEDLIRFELKQQMMSWWGGGPGGGGARGGFLSFIANVFGSSMGVPMAGPPALPGSGGTVIPGMGVQAKGGAWDAGVMKFAQGGMFTNGIVSQPTLFKFAKGTGLMGEAGPEAIMPLTRDGSGNLGVRAEGGGSNVDIVVNNYSGEKAHATETKDSRGNRRIEVTIGEMTAGQLSKSGSTSQTALKSTFGLRPQLIRR